MAESPPPLCRDRSSAHTLPIALAAACVGLVACGIPTEPPVFETQWATVGPAGELPVDSALPPSVSLTPDRLMFWINLPTRVGVHPLGDLCAECAAMNGQTVLKPAFTGRVSVSIPFPEGLVGGELTSGNIAYELENRLGFDPLQPGLANRGSIVAEILADGVVVGADSVQGITTSFPNGSVLGGTIALTSEGVAADSVALAITITSPLGQPTRMNSAGTLRVRATTSGLELASAIVELDERPLALKPTGLPLQGLDDRFRARLEGGTLHVSAFNQFARPLVLSLEVAADSAATPFVGSATIAPSTSGEIEIALSRAELLTLVGSTGLLWGSVVLLGTGPIAVSPLPLMTFTTEWRFNLVSVG